MTNRAVELSQRAEAPLDSFQVPLLNDTDLARWFDEWCFEGTVRFNEALGWYEWDGIHWKSVNERHILKKISVVLKEYERQARLREDYRDAAAGLVKRLSSASGKALLAQLEVQTYTDAVFFETDPYLFNVKNGVVDLRTGQLSPHEKNLGFRHVAGASYVPGASHIDWFSALDALEKDAQEALQVTVGQSISGYSPPDDKVNILQGPKAQNGKSTIVLALEAALGDFATFVSEKVLAGNKFDHPAEKMSLFGARLAILEELPNRVLSSKNLKDITGRKMSARYMHRNPVSWTTTHTLFITTNHALEFDHVDNAVKRRIRLFRFEKEYVEAPTAPNQVKRDATLRDRLMKGSDGRHEAILSWAIEGAVLWFGNGQQMPSEATSLTKARELWEKESDVLGNFFEEFVETSPNAFVATVDLLSVFNHYLASLGSPSWTMLQFTNAFEARDDLQKYRTRTGRARGGKARSFPIAPGVVPTMSKQPTCWFGVRFAA
jgi:putative DNA primase/helicase